MSITNELSSLAFQVGHRAGDIAGGLFRLIGRFRASAKSAGKSQGGGHTQVNGDGFKAFELTSLLPKTGFDVHVAKMAE